MKSLKFQILTFCISIIGIFALTSCEPDPYWWDDAHIEGSWRIVEVNGYSNYKKDDHWIFSYNGDFYTSGYNLPSENGYWERRGRTINISFQTYSEMEVYIDSYDNDYMVLYVRDYSFKQEYTLRLIRDRYFY